MLGIIFHYAFEVLSKMSKIDPKIFTYICIYLYILKISNGYFLTQQETNYVTSENAK